MKADTYRHQFISHGLLFALGAAACFAMATQPALAADAGAPAAKSAGAQQAPGMKVYIDPKTGALLNEPAPGTQPLELSPHEQNSRSTSHEGLVEVPSPVPGGGVGLNLQGRFMSPMIATVGPDGKVRVEHMEEASRPVDKR